MVKSACLRKASVPYYERRIVSLLDMLQFALHDYFRVSGALMKLCLFPLMPGDTEAEQEFQKLLDDIHAGCYAIGLTLSVNQVNTIIQAINSGKCKPAQLQALLQELHRRIFEELSAEVFNYIPRYKAEYADHMRFNRKGILEFGWTTVSEFQHAGLCYAVGENTACVFHLLRIVDAGIKSAVQRLIGKDFGDGNWNNLKTKIETEMNKKYGEKSLGWKQSEPFYASVLTDITAIGKLRNRAIHDYKATYSEDEAKHLLAITEGFVRHLWEGG